jgi:hypothetical protein
MNRKYAAIGLVVLLLLAGLLTKGFGLFGGGDRGALTLYGNVDIRSVDLGFRVPGRIAAIARVLAPSIPKVPNCSIAVSSRRSSIGWFLAVRGMGAD